MLRMTHRGFAALGVAALLVALAGICSLAVDYGRAQLAKTQLRGAVDAAARAGARDIRTSVAAAQSSALALAAANTCDGSPVVLDVNTDVESGTWNPANGSFTVLSGAARATANAVRVTTRRTIPLVWAKLVGKESCDVRASAIALATTSSVSGFQGLNGVELNNNAYFASYNAATTLYPNHTSAAANGLLATNGAIVVKNSNMVLGDVQVGPAGSIDPGLNVTGSRTTLAEALPSPAMPDWAPGPNPGGIPRHYTVNSNTTLQGGTYWFNSLTINNDLTFYGPATVYVNGDITIDAALTGAGELPSNLTIYQLGSNRTFGDSESNHVDVVATVYAPGAGFVFKNTLEFRGSGIFGTITCKNSADFYYDESAGAALGKIQTKLVQ